MSLKSLFLVLILVVAETFTVQVPPQLFTTRESVPTDVTVPRNITLPFGLIFITIGALLEKLAFALTLALLVVGVAEFLLSAKATTAPKPRTKTIKPAIKYFFIFF